MSGGTKFIVMDTVKMVEEKKTRKWVSGVGKDSEFTEISQGWWVVFSSCPASMFIGLLKPGLKTGDRVKITVERT